MRVEVDDAARRRPVQLLRRAVRHHQARTRTAPTAAAPSCWATTRSPPAASRSSPLDGRSLGANVGDVLSGTTRGRRSTGRSTAATRSNATHARQRHRTMTSRRSSPSPAPRSSCPSRPTTWRTSPRPTPQRSTPRSPSGVVTNLASPDIVALEEIQDNDGATDDGVVAADQTLSKLIAAIVAAGGPHYELPADQPGQRPGRRPAGRQHPQRLPVQPDAGVLRRPRLVGRRPLHGAARSPAKAGGRAALTLSPGRIDPTNPVWHASRKPLVGQFKLGSQTFFVIANHFDAKVGDQNADGRFQYPPQSSRRPAGRPGAGRAQLRRADPARDRSTAPRSWCSVT